MSSTSTAPTAGQPIPNLRAPRIEDGGAIWHLARASRVLDVNSPYAYLLWCRDFAASSIVAETPETGVVGFVIGYRRPDESSTLMVWQVAVDAAQRGQGIAGLMLDALVTRPDDAERPVSHLETTITDDNHASRRLFTTFAERHAARLERRSLFVADHFPHDGGTISHAPEVLHRIGPLLGCREN